MLSLTIDQPSDADQRIDKFLKKYLKEAPLGGIYKWLRTGKVKVNRKKVESMQTSKVSMMPAGLLDSFKEDEIYDLMAYLLSRGDRNHKMFKK